MVSLASDSWLILWRLLFRGLYIDGRRLDNDGLAYFLHFHSLVFLKLIGIQIDDLLLIRIRHNFDLLGLTSQVYLFSLFSLFSFVVLALCDIDDALRLFQVSFFIIIFDLWPSSLICLGFLFQLLGFKLGYFLSIEKLHLLLRKWFTCVWIVTTDHKPVFVNRVCVIWIFFKALNSGGTLNFFNLDAASSPVTFRPQIDFRNRKLFLLSPLHVLNVDKFVPLQ